MKAFLAQYWPWILLPLAVVLVILAILLVLAGHDDAPSPFDYPVF